MLTRSEARVKLKHYLQYKHGASLFLNEELKYPFEHPHNDAIMDRFLDRLERMEIIQPDPVEARLPWPPPQANGHEQLKLL